MLIRSIRARLAAWHTLAVAAVLALFSVGASLFLASSMRDRADQILADLTRA